MPSRLHQPRRAREIYTATLDLLREQGYDRLAIETVAARASVNKTTIYRWWPSKDALLAAALVNAEELDLPVPDTGSLRGDLLSLAAHIAGLLTRPDTARLVPALLGAAPERPETARAAAAFFADRLARETVVFDRARRRGELADGVEPATVMNLLGGALWFHLLLRGAPATAPDLATLVDTLLHGISPTE
ncbi:TetR/AcrR family transcriptional regulator [Streptomyces sp. XY332]|uniref:TetR/AcrR family transcriptional regulator n=1 Tax=Streptomyces sp. XY332 TaxID=1415561 RepID=UPI0006B22E1E|nr:TetR/AcrR family transcriptional regulator [Streptomyces sp. XY332]KOY55034.1 TetR family transcriptional regulator [Streptomyces sp. XY332]